MAHCKTKALLQSGFAEIPVQLRVPVFRRPIDWIDASNCFIGRRDPPITTHRDCPRPAPHSLRQEEFMGPLVVGGFSNQLPPLFGGEFPNGSEFASVNEANLSDSSEPLAELRLLCVMTEQPTQFEGIHGGCHSASSQFSNASSLLWRSEIIPRDPIPRSPACWAQFLLCLLRFPREIRFRRRVYTSRRRRRLIR
jgi:hypothetical protein